MVGLRTLGATIGNRGFLALAVCVVLFLFVYGGSSAIHQGLGLYIALTPIALAGGAVLLGSALALASRLLRPSATRLLRQPSSTTSVP
ncbi:MAG TPA: hypothetical protein VGN32_05190 [Ktedonobacterales bacterium]|nr:hypothetical protein [Ktedonobacterales bacterium]